jgi:hypothetical protein
MKRTTQIVLTALSCSVAEPAIAWERPTAPIGQLREYIGELQTEGSHVFMSSCQFNETLKAVLVFRPKKETGDFLFIADHVGNNRMAEALETGEVFVTSVETTVVFGHWKDAAADAAKVMALNLLALPFWVIPPDHLDVIYSEPAERAC